VVFIPLIEIQEEMRLLLIGAPFFVVVVVVGLSLNFTL
jgi:hypothetical protein